LKAQLKEKQNEDIAEYLFNYMKDPKENQVTKMSLKRVLNGLLIDNITEEQAIVTHNL